MILSANITEKSFGNTLLYTDVTVEINEGEKVGLIGRNGTGKSTLFHILNGDDTDFQGELHVKSGAIVISSRQEHHGHEDKTALEYIQGDLPEYQKLTHIIDTYPERMGDNTKLIQEYTDALERFGELGYYEIEEDIKQAFEKYQIDPVFMHKPLGELSGGQKRMVELIKVQRSRGHIALVDEPTNHMDYVAKESFVSWLKATKEAVLVITHDRDVLDNVDRMIEIRDGISYSFSGNYHEYLKSNKGKVTSELGTYDQVQKRIKSLEQEAAQSHRMRYKARTPNAVRRFRAQEENALAEIEELKKVEKPSFWIDQDTAASMRNSTAEAYDKYKATNIKVRTRKKTSDGSGRSHVQVEKLSLGYDNTPLFSDMSFALREGERLRIHGRNGAGKTTLIKALVAEVKEQPHESQVLGGKIQVEKAIQIGVYDQEINPSYLKMHLSQAIEHIYTDRKLSITNQKVKQLLHDYLFDPIEDAEKPVEQLSGGQKARLQLIAMLANDPQILVLDEPTNHLDLPSIEELENALVPYHGAILYVSHDSFFSDKIGGETITIGK
jgi:ATP-binding cassette subfamily F protein 3